MDNEDMLMEMIELQRYKLLNEDAENTRRLDACRDIFNQIMRELGVKVQTLISMDAHNMQVILNGIREDKANK